jgi:hypothetical protein
MMTDNETEQLLASLTPVSPRVTLQQRVEQDLELDRSWMRPGRPAVQQKRQRWLSSVVWASAGAAAAAVAFTLWPLVPASEADVSVAAEAGSDAAPEILPVSTIREWVTAEDQGIQWNDRSAPERRVRLTTMERQSWIDPRDGAEIVVEQPRQETVLLPVNFQ